MTFLPTKIAAALRYERWRGAFCLLAALIALPLAARADDGAWTEIRAGLFDKRTIESSDEALKLFAPRRAEDAAIVPVRVFIGSDLVRRARALTVVVDQNPAPVAAVFNFGDLYRTGGDIGDRSIEMRIRLESMSNVRAVIETDDGRLFEASQFVSGAGGCTSASLKDMDEAMAGLGKVRVRVGNDKTRGESWSELQVQIRHPNLSGMQIDTRTNTFLPAHFVEHVAVDAEGELLVTIESGIAISEDPNFRLSFADGEQRPVTLVARDSEGRVFRAGPTR